ncbi:MAG: sulfotransferase [Proteobacteria bacterium]|nr:sulfotransferase [Pseudomonadota bacterium]
MTHAGATPRPPFPVIVGCPRSGTSLLAVMLDTHPELAMPPETAFMKSVVMLDGDAERQRQRFVDVVTTDVTPISNWNDFGLARDAFVQRIAALKPFTVAAGLHAFFDLYAETNGKSRAGEKTPDDLFVMAQIANVLPEAHFIHVIRDPRDTVLSWSRTWFAPTRDLVQLARGWAEQVALARRTGAALPHYRETRYEDLVGDPARELARLCEWLGLDYAPAMTEPSAHGRERLARLHGRRHTSGRVVSEDDRRSIHVNLARPPLPQRAGAWRAELPPAMATAILDATGGLARQLGYDHDGAPHGASSQGSA